jgi:hypothetical protein
MGTLPFGYITSLIDISIVLGGLSLPTFHAMGMLCHLLYPLFTGYPTAMYQPQSPRPPVVTGPQIAMNALRRVGANFIFVVPAFLEVSIAIRMCERCLL